MAVTGWVTFDCFGTLIDWRHGMATSVDLLFPGRGAEVLERYGEHELVVEAEHPTMRYRDVMAESLRRAAADLGLPLLDDDASVLGATIPYWPAFSDVAAELGALRAAGWRLALLTNCDRDLIGATQRRLGAVIDAVVTAEHVGSYKPALGHFRRFEESFDPGPGRWVHVAQGYHHDMEPAHRIGLPSVWINRLGEQRDESICGAVQSDLGDLPAVVERVRAAAA